MGQSATVKRRPSARLISAFAAIYFIWGSTFLAIKYAIATLPPFAMAAMRFLVAGSVLMIWSLVRSSIRPKPIHWLHAAIIGVLMLTIGNGAVVWSELRVSSGLAALVVSVIPLWVVLMEWLRPGGQQPHGLTFVGVVLGLIGMVLLIGPGALRHSGDVDPVAAVVLLAGSLAWSVATVFGRKAAVPGYPPLTSAMQLLGGAAGLIMVSIVAGEPAQLQRTDFTTQAILAVLYLATFGSIVAFSAYSWLLRVAQPARIATYAYVNPVVAMLLGWVIAGEKLTSTTIVAGCVIPGGVALITTGINRQ
ncbi:MAG TPA: EamA family transporter [Longimicrobiales bacterium]